MTLATSMYQTGHTLRILHTITRDSAAFWQENWTDVETVQRAYASAIRREYPRARVTVAIREREIYDSSTVANWYDAAGGLIGADEDIEAHVSEILVDVDGTLLDGVHERANARILETLGGVWSDGSCRIQDVLPALVRAARYVARVCGEAGHAVVELNDAIRYADAKLTRYYCADADAEEEEEEELYDALDALDNAVNEVLPHPWYWGSAEGDGACFGIWRADD